MNARLARRLREVADLLQEQEGNLFRVQAYRNAARQIESCGESVEEIWRRGGEGELRKRLGIGERLAGTIVEWIGTGKLKILDRLRGEADPVRLLESIPGIGTALAERLHFDLQISSLEDLEAALYDGRLASMERIGPKRAAAILNSIQLRLSRLARRPEPGMAVPVEELLDVDREYRQRAAEGTLALIAPKRMNPSHKAWLPILHTDRGPRHYTALYSNTARAHQLGKTGDWVVLYCDDDGEQQWTVVTETRGRQAGHRVVRGREQECETNQSPPPLEGSTKRLLST